MAAIRRWEATGETTQTNKDLAYVKEECENLAWQLLNVARIMAHKPVYDQHRRMLASRRALKRRLSPAQRRKQLHRMRKSGRKFNDSLNRIYSTQLLIFEDE